MMKIYNLKLFLLTIFLSGGILIFELIKLINGQLSSLVQLALWGYLFILGLWTSLSQKGYAKDQLRESIHKKTLTKLFGPWKFLAPYLGVILVILAGIGLEFLPSLKWIFLLLLILGVIYQIWVTNLIGKHIKLEERRYFQ